MSFNDFDPSSRPKIWAEGTQHPPFEPRAFALASVLFARQSLAGLFTRCATSASEFGQTVAVGQWKVPEHRLGRSGRYLPSVAATAGVIRDFAEVLKRAAHITMPESEEAEPVKSIFDKKLHLSPDQPPSHPAPATQAAVDTPARAAASDEDPELAAIRQMMESAAAAPPRRAKAEAAPQVDRPAAPAVPAAEPADTGFGWRRDWLKETTASILGYGILVMSVPLGAALAALAHLHGEDLRKLVKNED